MSWRDSMRLIAAIVLIECIGLGLAWLGVWALDTEAEQPIAEVSDREERGSLH